MTQELDSGPSLPPQTTCKQGHGPNIRCPQTKVNTLTLGNLE